MKGRIDSEPFVGRAARNHHFDKNIGLGADTAALATTTARPRDTTRLIAKTPPAVLAERVQSGADRQRMKWQVTRLRSTEMKTRRSRRWSLLKSLFLVALAAIALIGSGCKSPSRPGYWSSDERIASAELRLSR